MPIPISVAYGAYGLIPREDAQLALAAADRAMYRQKRDGLPRAWSGSGPWRIAVSGDDVGQPVAFQPRDPVAQRELLLLQALQLELIAVASSTS